MSDTPLDPDLRLVPLPEAAREGVAAVAPPREVVWSTTDDPSSFTPSGGAIPREIAEALINQGALAERARIRQMALDKARRMAVEGPDGRWPHEVLEDFAALLEEP